MNAYIVSSTIATICLPWVLTDWAEWTDVTGTKAFGQHSFINEFGW